MDPECNFLLITANVGSLFEEPSMQNLQATWFTEIMKLVTTSQPSFLAIHCQECGGKKSENNRDLVHKFVNELYAKPELSEYKTNLAYLDEDYKSEDQYTALGSFYFVKNSVNAELWNYQESQFKAVSQEKEIFPIVQKNVPTVQKQKYPLDCFPKRKWSRKGFMQTRWRIGGRIFDLVNIHLVHDVCNVKALQQSPSKYTHFRRESLAYTLNQLNNNETDHRIIFGDFNTRLDTKLFVENHLSNSKVQSIQNDGEKKPHSVIFKAVDDHEEELLHVGARKFDIHHLKYFSDEHISKLLTLDKEFEWCQDELKELEIKFLPTYPHSEDPKTDAVYSDTRCPAWCDRVLFDVKTHEELKKDGSTAIYDCIGKEICIGDHKPVFLSFSLPSSQQTAMLGHGEQKR